MIITLQDIENQEKLYRTAFINSLAGFKQAVLVGTKSKEGVSNLAIFNSLIHLGANPALFGLMSRPDVVQRDTMQNMLDSRVYSLNLVASSDYKKAHQTSARYPKSVSEFEKVGFTEEYKKDFFAPFVAEALVKIGMKFEQRIDITLNGTVMLIGSISYVELDDNLVGEDGFVDLAKADVLVSQGLDAYFKVTPIGRLPYAKP